MVQPQVTQNYLKSILEYNETTGVFTWKKRRWCRENAVAGYVNPAGYRIIMINGKNYTASRLVWLYMTGRWPKYQIDHIDHVRDNNRFNNLREVTNQENQMNRRFMGNSSGFRGVYWDKSRKKWSPKIKVNQKIINMGRYDTLEEAISMRLCAESVYGFHINHGS